jgi:hypothetical protein
MNNYSIIYLDDPNNFIATYFTKHLPSICLKKNDQLNIDMISHAVVFDDGEEFYNDTELLKSKNIPIRIIKIAITRVINIKKQTEFKSEKSTSTYEYIGRGSYWGNPYSMYEVGENREEVIRKYKYDFDYEKFPNKEKSEVYKLIGKRLGCFCKPESCHGDVLANHLNSWDDGK